MRVSPVRRSGILVATLTPALAMFALSAACGLDPVTAADGVPPLSSDVDAGTATDPEDDGTTPGTPDDGTDSSTPEPDASDTGSPDVDATSPDPVDGGPGDASDVDARSPLYRADWFDRTSEAPTWAATWWKADTCRNKAGTVGSVIGPKIIESGSKKEVLPAPAADQASQEAILDFPRAGSIWPSKNGASDIADPTVTLGVRSNAFCARFQASLDLPAGQYKLGYKVSDSLVVYVGTTLVSGPKWYEDIFGAGATGTTQDAKADVTIAGDGPEDIRIYYNNVVADALLKVTLEGPL